MDEVFHRLQHYGLKSRQHLRRVRLSDLLAVKTLAFDTSADDLEQRLEQLSFDENESDVFAKLPTMVHEIHLVALKANFELYLNRVATVAWHSRLTQAAREPLARREEFGRLLKKTRLSREELIDVLLGGARAPGAVELLVDKIVPRQGLDALTDCLQIATGVSLRATLEGAKDPRTWAQIAVAFEIRHLVEHRDGKVDARFREAVKRHWSNSTWGRVSVADVKKVAVEYDDVTMTFEAMLQATELLTRDLLEWCSAAKP